MLRRNLTAVLSPAAPLGRFRNQKPLKTKSTETVASSNTMSPVSAALPEALSILTWKLVCE